jgi:Uncharacterized protein conserved in bacteria
MWRSLRLIADVGFHQKKKTRKEMKDLFEQFTWDTSDTVNKELTRYQGTQSYIFAITLFSNSYTIVNFQCIIYLSFKNKRNDLHKQNYIKTPSHNHSRQPLLC